MNYHLTTILCVTLLACGVQTETKQKVIDNDKEVVCFVYHRFGDNRYPSTNIALETFKAHLQFLKENGFQVLTLSAAIDYLSTNGPKQKTAVITIDDGYTSFYKNGLPILTKYSFPATLFINTETVGGGDYMDWKDINSAIKLGIEIGNHTHSHAYFLNLPETNRYEAFEQEITKSQQLINENTGLTPQVFAYPYGEWDVKMKSIVKKLGFKGAAAQNSGVIDQGTDMMQIPRFPMAESFGDIKNFSSKAKMKALRVVSQSPNSPQFTDDIGTPTLKLTFDGTGLLLNQLQCFIQGSECKTEVKEMENGIVQLTLSPSISINNRRRTLYTITVPDKNGQWHWYSHLWVNAVVK
ncbi:MAG TPA: polysaccharide deacetylase family protein [Fulvivirga sp.]|nr:polysaccharide deacetylase family protein [Fulvivirga sp.]